MLDKLKIFIAAAVLSVTVSANVQAATVTVEKGDTLWDLSNEHDTSVENIQKVNHLSSDLIHPGDKLTIPQEKHYIVKNEDTLIDIAKEQHVTVSQIKEWNDLITDLIHPGQDLLLYKNVKAEPIKPEVTKPAKKKQKVDKPKVKAASTSNTGKKQITVKATAYTAFCEGCSGTTATGIDLRANPNKKVIAVDPSVIPLGSKVYVEGFGEAIAGDTGGAIKGNRIDVFIPSEAKANEFGVKHLKVTILD